MVRKGEHKNVFAYSVQTACDKNGWILGYSVNPGNQSMTAGHLNPCMIR